MKKRDADRAPEEYRDYLSILEATGVLGFKHSQYTRRLLHESVAAIAEGGEPKFPWPEDGRPLAIKLEMQGYEKWYIHPDSVAGYSPKASPIGGSGMRRYVLRFQESLMDADAVAEALTAAFGDAGPDTWVLEPAYKPGKSKGKGKGKVAKETGDYTAAIVHALTMDYPRATGQSDAGKPAPAAGLDG